MHRQELRHLPACSARKIRGSFAPHSVAEKNASLTFLPARFIYGPRFFRRRQTLSLDFPPRVNRVMSTYLLGIICTCKSMWREKGFWREQTRTCENDAQFIRARVQFNLRVRTSFIHAGIDAFYKRSGRLQRRKLLTCLLGRMNRA